MFNKESTPTTKLSSTSSKLDTLVGNNTTLTGDINFSGVLNLDGTVKGSIIGAQGEDALIISESGAVEGKIEVANIIINGSVNGDIIASGKIEVASKANIQGNVYYQNIEMEAGSKINGQLIYQEAGKASKIAKIDDKRNK